MKCFMNQWIAELWRAVGREEWGTVGIIGAVQDLCDLADCGIIEDKAIDEALRMRVNAEFSKLIKYYRPRTLRNWESARQCDVEAAA